MLGGSGLAWQDEVVHEVRAGDCIIQRADELEHTFIAGAEGLDYLVFGTRNATEFGWLPRSRAVRIGWPWVEGRDDDPWDIEAQAPPLAVGEPAERPANIVNIDEVELKRRGAVVTATWSVETYQQFVESTLMPAMGKVAAARGLDPSKMGEPEVTVTEVHRIVR